MTTDEEERNSLQSSLEKADRAIAMANTFIVGSLLMVTFGGLFGVILWLI